LHILKPNEYFNPINNYKFVIDTFPADTVLGLKMEPYSDWMYPWTPQNLKGEKFLLPGKYKLQFVYSTKVDTAKFHNWLIRSSFPGQQEEEFDTTLLNKIPEILIKSNIVELKYRIF
jgi:hypothetical protein